MGAEMNNRRAVIGLASEHDKIHWSRTNPLTA